MLNENALKGGESCACKIGNQHQRLVDVDAYEITKNVKYLFRLGFPVR